MKSERKRLTTRLDKLCLEIVRLKNKDTCQRCGKHVEGCDSHPSHVIPKGNGASWRRFDLKNIQLLCFNCHIGWWHKNITEAGKWFAYKFPKLDRYLEKYRYGKACPIKTFEMKYMVDKYKKIIKELIG